MMQKNVILDTVKGIPPHVTRTFTIAPQTREDQYKEQMKIVSLINAYYKAKEETSENPFIFTCPVCGNDAKGGYIPLSEHYKIECKTCDRQLWQ